MLRKCSVAVLLLGVLLVIGCTAHLHKVGEGAQGDHVVEVRQWYVLYGLLPINKVDTNAIAGETTDYEIMTLHTKIDFIINVFTGIASVTSRTVIVRK